MTKPKQKTDNKEQKKKQSTKDNGAEHENGEKKLSEKQKLQKEVKELDVDTLVEQQTALMLKLSVIQQQLTKRLGDQTSGSKKRKRFDGPTLYELEHFEKKYEHGKEFDALKSELKGDVSAPKARTLYDLYKKLGKDWKKIVAELKKNIEDDDPEVQVNKKHKSVTSDDEEEGSDGDEDEDEDEPPKKNTPKPDKGKKTPAKADEAKKTPAKPDEGKKASAKLDEVKKTPAKSDEPSAKKPKLGPASKVTPKTGKVAPHQGESEDDE